MKTTSTLTELRRMKPEDLRGELAGMQASVAKLRMNLHMGKEKNSARYKKEKKQLARMLTILSMTSSSHSPSAS